MWSKKNKNTGKQQQTLQLHTSDQNNTSRKARMQKLMQQNQQEEQENKRPNSGDDNDRETKKQRTNDDDANVDDPADVENESTDSIAPGLVEVEEQEDEILVDLFHFNPHGEVESDEGLVLQALDSVVQSPTGIEVDHSMCTPGEVRRLQSSIIRMQKGKTFKSPKKMRDKIINEAMGVELVTLDNFGGQLTVKAKFVTDFDKVGAQLQNMVKEVVFKNHKFPMSTRKEMSIVLDLVEQGNIKWENQAAKDTEVALLFHRFVGQKIAAMRSGCVALARSKFLHDGTKELGGPVNLNKKMRPHYRQYFDSDKKLKPGMEPFWDAFCYFVLRILSSVNASQTKFGEAQKKNRMTLLISDVFSVSDEAFALAMVENYYRCWMLQQRYKPICKKNKEKPNFWRQPQFDAYFSSSAQGRKDQGWNDEGLSVYNDFCALVKARRTGTPDKPDVVDEMFRKRYAASFGFDIDDNFSGPIGAARQLAAGNPDEPTEALEAWMEQEQEANLERLGAKLSQT